MRGLTLENVKECGFDDEYASNRNYRLLGLACVLAPWIVALSVWLVCRP